MLTLEDLIEFERRWEDRLGGDMACGLREVLCYTGARLVAAFKAEPDDVCNYLREGLELGISGGVSSSTAGGDA